MFYIFVALLFYTAAILLGAYASRRTDSTLVTTITNALAMIIPLATFGFLAAQQRIGTITKAGVLAAVACGIAIAIFAMALNKSFTTDKVAIVTPVVFGGAIILSTIFGFVLFKEKISPFQGIGLVLMTAGLVFVTYAKATGR
jgi:drug/metabolite transporter (DMT)-like permease